MVFVLMLPVAFATCDSVVSLDRSLETLRTVDCGSAAILSCVAVFGDNCVSLVSPGRSLPTLGIRDCGYAAVLSYVSLWGQQQQQRQLVFAPGWFVVVP